MTILDYYEGIAAAKRTELSAEGTSGRTMSRRELDGAAYATHASKKKKGVDKGYKYTYTTVWSGTMSQREYLDKLNEIDPRTCGLFLCEVEQSVFTSDRYWDVPSYRDEAIRHYRDRIKAIRLKHGLSKSDVTEFMRVG